MGLVDDVEPGLMAIDTGPFIYFMEENPTFFPVVAPLFEALDAGRAEATTSALTLCETLVRPLREGDETTAAVFRVFLANSRGLTLVPVSLEVLEAAAQLRAATRLKTPDAIHVASALLSGCSTFITSDRRLPDLGALKVLQVNHYR